MLTYLSYIALGLLPSLIWLVFYLKKDKHPEPKRKIVQVFIWGMLIAPLAVLAEYALFWLTKLSFSPSEIITSLTQHSYDWQYLLALIFFAPLVEEYLKYKIVKIKIINSSDFDEPTDAMVYLITGALGFAAAENLLLILNAPLAPWPEALGIMSIRFIGATLLHALASGIVGYFLAKAFYHPQKRFPLVIQGLTLAIVLHGGYNYLILNIAQATNIIAAYQSILLIAALLTAMALFVSYGFKSLKKELSICKIR